MGNKGLKISIDGREFKSKRQTGIGRVIIGILNALIKRDFVEKIYLSVYSNAYFPTELKSHNKIRIIKSPVSYLRSEKLLTEMTKQIGGIFISPYPKLPLFGTYCQSIHIVHDVLFLTNKIYKKKFKSKYDKWRLKKALFEADISWYDSEFSLKETRRICGNAGNNPRVRYLGIDSRFNSNALSRDMAVLKTYNLIPGYIIVIGNGLPHKNLGTLLKISDKVRRTLVFIGVNKENQDYWKSKFLNKGAKWIKHVEDRDLPSLIRNAFCLAQPSTEEGFGFPPLEAMACGVPAVISNIPVLKETTGCNALISNKNDSECWLSAFNSLSKRKYYQGIVEKGLDWVEPLLGTKAWDRHIDDIAQLFKKN
jgi:glycosyltransferase involved in cell wall biosynthesis